MAIKVKPRATVLPEVSDLYVWAAEQRLRLIHEKLESIGSRTGKKGFLNKTRGSIARLAPIVRGKNGLGFGLDLEMTRMRALDYDRIWTTRYMGELYLVARTHDLMMEEYGHGSKITGHWDAGPYAIYIPAASFGYTNLNAIHCIPVRDPWTGRRHPHHTAQATEPAYDEDPETSERFLSARVSTCWSQFAAPLALAVEEVNLPEYLRLMFTFVNRYYSGSPLATPGRQMGMDYMWRVP